MRNWISLLLMMGAGLGGYIVSHSSGSGIETLDKGLDSITERVQHDKTVTETRMMTSLTFQDGNAENAMKLYTSLFEDSRILDVKRWEKGSPVEEGKIMQATFELNGSLFMCSDSPPVHEWGFTPAVSVYVDCASESELDKLFAGLSEGGNVTMPLNNYGFSQKFGWVIDRYGVSWQLNLN